MASSEIIIYGTHSQQSYIIEDLDGQIDVKLPYTTRPGTLSINPEVPTFVKYPTKIGCDVIVDERYSGRLVKFEGKSVTILTEHGFMKIRKYNTIQMSDQDVSLSVIGKGNYVFNIDFDGLYWKPMNKVFIHDGTVTLEIGGMLHNDTLDTFSAEKTILFQKEYKSNEEPVMITLEGDNVIEPGVRWLRIEIRETSFTTTHILEDGMVETTYKVKVDEAIPAGKYRIYRNIGGIPIFFKDDDNPKIPDDGVLTIKKRMTNVKVFYEDGELRIKNNGPGFKLQSEGVLYDVPENETVTL